MLRTQHDKTPPQQAQGEVAAVEQIWSKYMTMVMAPAQSRCAHILKRNAAAEGQERNRLALAQRHTSTVVCAWPQGCCWLRCW